ncbi:ParB/RepB/Spo0J family partition protein [Butyrivibrio fibrisolvens]|uniref:ParB/RepB/Spo0J family partition protein n=1 Tax=Butyrivibrio fibrisolvens TaxID=831 RepID=UPI0004274A77|nr:ParB/RepB/Spo0J family partition protein [Butyrivibrio fibrisolvens]
MPRQSMHVNSNVIAAKYQQKDSQSLDIALDKLVENKENEELFGGVDEESIQNLANGIKKDGFRGVINVWDKRDGTYEIYSGHRRVRALKQIGYNKLVPCAVSPYPEKETDRQRLLLAFNIHSRGSIYAAASGKSIYITRQINLLKSILKKEGFTGNVLNEIASEFGTSVTTVKRYMRLNDCTDAVINAESEGLIPLSIASTMSTLSESVQDKTIDMIKEAVANGREFSRNELTEYIKNIKNDSTDENLENMRNELLGEIAFINLFGDQTNEQEAEEDSIDVKPAKKTASPKNKIAKSYYDKYEASFTKFEKNISKITDENERLALKEHLTRILKMLK